MREKPGSYVGLYIETLFRIVSDAECTDAGGERMTLDDACVRVCNLCHDSHDSGGKIMFIGNGGSMGIAAHMAVDFSKNGGLRSMAFGDSAVLTCLSNDFGYHDVFARQIEWHGNALDVFHDILCALDRRGVRQLHVDEQITLVLGRDKPFWRLGKADIR